MTRALSRYAHERIGAGLAHVVSAQDADGLWRDYTLAPGPGEGWCTAWVGWHVSRLVSCLGPAGASAVRRAAVALRRIRGPGGWGYNHRTGADADSTAWALRFLRRAGVRCGGAEAERLSQYVDREGRVHTFEDTGYGSWSDAHDDVTPVVGLALLCCDGRAEALTRVRAAVARAQRADGLWTSFWWASDVYASFWSVYFLRRSGGLPAGVRGRIHARLTEAPAHGSALESALWLLLALELDHCDRSLQEQLVDRLLAASNEHGWPGSPLLLVPPREAGEAAAPRGPHADERGLMTTAAACWALARWNAQFSAGRDGRSITGTIVERIRNGAGLT